MKKFYYIFYVIIYILFLLVGPELQDFDEEDIEKVQKDDKYVWQFLAYKDKDVDRALEMMVMIVYFKSFLGIVCMLFFHFTLLFFCFFFTKG